MFVSVCVSVYVCECLSLNVIRCNNTPMHLQQQVDRGKIKEERRNIPWLNLIWIFQIYSFNYDFLM